MNMSECIICQLDNARLAGEFGKNLTVCTKCGLVWYNGRDEIVPSQIYSKDYFESCYFNYADEKPILRRNFKYRLATIRKFAPHGNVLEIGTAYGFFLELAQEFYATQGIDVSADAVKRAKAIAPRSVITCGDYLAFGYQKNFFDAVCLFDTIEHLQRPDWFIAKAHSELKKNGIICITTGDISSVAARMQKKKWRLIDPPKHVYYFSARNLTALLKKNNFEVVHRSYPGVWRSLAFICYGLFFKKQTDITKGRLFSLMQKIPVYINLFDIMFVIAKKRG